MLPMVPSRHRFGLLAAVGAKLARGKSGHCF
jgi:hypothetical protein